MSERVLPIPDRCTIYALPAGNLSLMPDNKLPGEPISLEVGRNVLSLAAQGISYFDIATRLGLDVAEIPGKLQEMQAFFGAATSAQTTCLAHESGTLRTTHSGGYSWLQLSDSAVEAARLARLGYDGSPTSAEDLGVDPLDAIPMFEDLLQATNAGSSLPLAMHTLYANDFFVAPDIHTKPQILFKAVGAETLPDYLAEIDADPFMRAIVHPSQPAAHPGSWSARQLRCMYGLAQGYDNETLKTRFNMSGQLVGPLVRRLTQMMEVQRADVVQRAFDLGVFGALLPVDLQTWRTAMTTSPNPWF